MSETTIQTSGSEGRFTGAIELTRSAAPQDTDSKAGQEQQQEEQPKPEGNAEQAPPVDWEKRYKDAQAELTKLQQERKANEPSQEQRQEEQPKPEGEEEEPSEQDTEEADTGDEEAGEEESLEEQIAAKVDVPKYESEFAKDGKLSDESYAELAAKGFTRDDVDDFVAFRQARNERFASAVSEEVGGDDAWGEIQAWAKEEMSADDRDAFNKGMADAASKRDIKQARLLAAGVVQKYHEAKGFAPSRSATEGGTGGDASRDTGGYGSMSEWQTDNRSEAYQKDPTERARVDAKLQRSGWYKAQHGLK